MSRIRPGPRIRNPPTPPTQRPGSVPRSSHFSRMCQSAWRRPSLSSRAPGHPALRDEQSANARSLVEAAAAIAVTESELTPARLASEVAAMLGDPGRAADMADPACAKGRPEAAKTLADLVEELAARGAP